MAGERKKDPKPEDPKSKGKHPSDSVPNLELPSNTEHDLEEPLEVVEVVEDDIPVVEELEPEAVEVVEDVVEVVEEAPQAAGTHRHAVDEVEVVDEPAEMAEAALDVVEIVEETPSGHPVAVDMVEVVEEPHQGEQPPPFNAPKTRVAGKAPVPTMLGQHEDEAQETHPAAGKGRGGPRQDPALTREASEDALDVTDVVEVLPSSSHVIEAPLVEEAEAEVVDEVEPVTDIAQTLEAIPKLEDSATGIGKPQGPAPEDIGLEYDEVLVEGESEIDLGRRPGAKGERPSGVDIIAEALESGVDLGRTKAETPSAEKKETGSESDIDLESILEDSGESSAVDLGGSGQETALPSSGQRKSGHLTAGDSEEGHAELVTAEESAEDAEFIGASALIDSDETQAVDVLGDDDDEVLVTPKKKAAFTEDVVDIFEDPLATVSEEGAAEEVKDEAESKKEKPEAAPAKPAKKSAAKQLVAAGGGGRRGGLMPFLLGLVAAGVLSIGGGAAAWYMGMLPDAPGAKKGTGKVSPKAPVASETDQALTLLSEGKAKDARKLVEKAAEKTPEAALRTLIDSTESADANLKEIDRLKEANSGSADKLLALEKEKAKIAGDLAAAQAKSDNADNESKSLAKKLEAAANSVKEADNARLAAEKERDGVKTVRQALDDAVDAALAALSKGGFLSKEDDKLSKLEQLAKGTEEASRPTDTTKLRAELAAAKDQNIIGGTPEHRLDTMVALLGNRAYSDAKEFSSFKRYLDWVRSKDSKASPEARAKALYVDALMQRNQQNFADARQKLEQAVKEAEALNGETALKTGASQSLKELTDPTAYYLPRVQRKIADGQLKAAAEELSAALKALPDQPQLAAETFYLAGRLDEESGDWAKAEQNYRQALKLVGEGPASDRYRAALAQVLLRSAGSSSEQAPEGDDPVSMGTDDDQEQSFAQVVFVDQDGGNDAKLAESIRIAQDLINRGDTDKAKGEGYMILGAAQARQGKATEGLKNFVKGMKMVHPDWSTQELDRMVANHPAFQQPDFAMEPNPLMADKHFGKGVELFWAKKYGEAEMEFAKAVSYYKDDARYRYFLGMSRHLQGTKEKRKMAQDDFEQGLLLELARQPSTREINASLERVQGDLRKVLNQYRERSQ